MPNYTAVLSKKAQKQLDKLTDTIAEPIFIAIANLEENPRPQGYIKLKGREGYRIRVGNFRIIYDIYDKQLIVDIITLGHRKDIYE
jgi:mRNA interferase RelE/StbE